MSNDGGDPGLRQGDHYLTRDDPTREPSHVIEAAQLMTTLIQLIRIPLVGIVSALHRRGGGDDQQTPSGS